MVLVVVTLLACLWTETREEERTVYQFSENRKLFKTANGQTPCYDLTQTTAV